VAETWVVLTEVQGVLSISTGESEEEAEAMVYHALKAKGATKVSAAGVIKVDHSIRAASLISYRRAGHAEYGKADGEAEKPKPSTAAYDALVPFGYDLDRELFLGHAPPEERLIQFAQKIGIPVILKKKVDAPPPKKEGPKLTEQKSFLPVVAVIFLIALVVVAGFLLKK